MFAFLRLQFMLRLAKYPQKHSNWARPTTSVLTRAILVKLLAPQAARFLLTSSTVLQLRLARFLLHLLRLLVPTSVRLLLELSVPRLHLPTTSRRATPREPGHARLGAVCLRLCRV